MTYEKVCEKLGFDPMVNPPKYEGDGWTCDDHTPSPYTKLTYEESKIIWEKMFGETL